MALRLVGLTALLIVNALAVYLELDHSISPMLVENTRQMDELTQKISHLKEQVDAEIKNE